MNVVNNVFQTTNYDLFKIIDGNREINMSNLKRIKNSMQDELLVVPIIVNENHEIIDGQHRFFAAKQLKLPINFIINEGYGYQQIHKLNTVGKKWSFYDYLEGYAKKGYQDYQDALKFYNKYQFGANETLGLLLGYSCLSGGDDRKKFFDGKFKVKDLKEAYRKAEMINMIKPYYTGYKRRSFIAALMNLFSNKEFDFTSFIQKLGYQSTKLVDCATTKQYLIVMEGIYNYKKSDKDKVRFI